MSDKFIEIPENHHWFWYMKEDSPMLELRSPKSDNFCISYGHVRSWIEKNANGTVFIQFGNCFNKRQASEITDRRILILFDDPADYMAFKIMFPELCRI